ncbi:superoxide dismutase family protein [Nonlabens ponticola]|uniref:Superoxide dismutase family protein n=1 Tax=Nonlabens ponticola TaxID=2496866 RepID=A0A3S9MYD0_9FLAO|nr:superoxide dismutase family protein [Nonlabens ponticola]AZQ44149.1 superoxide dismutase family protein [Nonlabens ponticola]
MKKLNIALLALALTLSIASCKENKEEENMDSNNTDMEMEDSSNEDENMDEPKTVNVPMGSKSGSDVTGSIIFTEKGDEVEMVVELVGLEEGSHAIHLHQNGDCSADDASSAGGHWNPTSEDHGSWGDNQHHKGDIGNLQADAEGNASLVFSTDKWCIGCDDENKNIVGKGVIVHAKADDFTSQPSGAAGARVACGVVE